MKSLDKKMGKKKGGSGLPKYLREEPSSNRKSRNNESSSSQPTPSPSSNKPSSSAVRSHVADAYIMKLVDPPLDKSMKDKCNQLMAYYQELESIFSDVEPAEDVIRNNLQLFQKVEELIRPLSYKMLSIENRNYFFLYQGIRAVCKLLVHLSSYVSAIIDKENEYAKLIVKSISAISFLLYKLSEHGKARQQMLEENIFPSMWLVLQEFSKKMQRERLQHSEVKLTIETLQTLFPMDADMKSISYHFGEVMDLLGDGTTIYEELKMLLYSANQRHYKSDIKISDPFGASCADFFLAVVDLPEELLELSQKEFNLYLKSSNTRIELEDFDIKAHFPILKSRLKEQFFKDYLFKWNDDSEDITPGFYIFKKGNASRLQIVKFLELVYTDSMKISSLDTEVIHDLATCLEKKTSEVDETLRNNLLEMIHYLKRSESKKQAERAITQKVSDGDTAKTMLDDFDIENICKIIQVTSTFNISHNMGAIVDVENERKKNTKKQSLVMLPITIDIYSLFTSAMEREKYSAADILLTTFDGEKTEIDQLVDSNCKTDSNIRGFVKSIMTNNGLPLHRCILSARSDYLKKVFQYEFPPKCAALLDMNSHSDHLINTEQSPFPIADLSYYSVYIMFKYIYGGTTAVATSPVPVECLVEIFVASDLYLLFGLKRYSEDLIIDWIKQLNFTSQHAKFEDSTEYELLHELYELAIIYNAPTLKQECHDAIIRFSK